jgi:hypothetical protein
MVRRLLQQCCCCGSYMTTPFLGSWSRDEGEAVGNVVRLTRYFCHYWSTFTDKNERLGRHDGATMDCQTAMPVTGSEKGTRRMNVPASAIRWTPVVQPCCRVLSAEPEVTISCDIWKICTESPFTICTRFLEWATMLLECLVCRLDCGSFLVKGNQMPARV